MMLTPNLDRLILAKSPVDVKAEDELQTLKARIRELEAECTRLREAYAMLVPGKH